MFNPHDTREGKPAFLLMLSDECLMLANKILVLIKLHSTFKIYLSIDISILRISFNKLSAWWNFITH
jgi:hypothetical protein